MESWLADVRFALRQLVRRPLFSLVVITTLALGIGGNAAIFTVADQVLLRPLPYETPDRLVRVYTQFPGLGFDRFWVSAPEMLELAQWSRTLDSVGAWADGSVNVSDGENPVRVRGALANAALFETLGVPAARGRWFTAEEDIPGADPVVVLGHDLWQRMLGGDPDVVGRSLQVDGVTRTVVGVMPEGFDVAEAGLEIWAPLQLDPADPGGRGSHYLEVVARLADGATLATARQEMAALMERWEETVPPDTHHPNPDGHAVVVHPLHLETVGSARTPILLLLGAVGFVLLIACANVANLLLVRAEGRKREIAVRASLGADRGRLVRQFLTESLVLSALGGASGLLLAWVGLESMLAAYPEAVPRAGGVGLDGRALAFTAGVTILTGLLFGLAPALRARAGRLFAALKDGGRSSGGASTHAVRRLLVATEVALATVLVLGAGLLLRSFWTLQQVDPGFEPGGAVTFQISLPRAEYPEASAVRGFYDRLLDRLRVLPGVETAAAFSGLPPQRDVNANDTEFEGVETSEELPGNVDYYQIVTPDYFRAMRIPLVAGRGFRPQEGGGSPPVVVVNQTLADRYYPDGNAVGKRIRRGWWGDDEPWFTIVGVAADVKQGGLDQPTGTELYLLHDQWDNVEGMNPARTLYVVVRTAGDPLGLVPASRDAVRQLDPSLPLAELQTLDRVVEHSLDRPRFLTLLVGVFAALALLLAAVGTYGVLAYAVEERRHEVGVRMALGADRRQVLALVVGQGMVPVLAGLGVGLAGAFLLSRFVASQLYQVAPTDPLTYLVVPAVLLAVSLLACLLPGRSATRTDPAVALRAE